MSKVVQSDLSVNVIASIIVSLLFLVTGFLWGKYKEKRRKFGRNLEEYRLLPVHRQSREFWRVQPERFSAGHALLPQEPRSHGGTAAHFHW